MSCRHPLCELLDSATCSIAANKSRGCRPGLAAKTVDPAVYDAARALLATIAGGGSAERRDAAAQLAALVRREAREDRNLLAHARDDDPELAAELERLLARRP